MLKHLKINVVFWLSFFLPFVANAKLYLVSVGINTYPQLNKELHLTAAVSDAKTINEIYKRNTDNRCVALLLDEKATSKNIITAIKKVFKEADEDDAVVFYFSGHGSPYRNGLQTYDGSLTYAKIREAMADSKCPNKTMFIDACYAGNLRSNNSNNANINEDAQEAHVMLFLSSRGNETSLQITNDKNSLFTKYLQEGLRGKADYNKDRIITAKEIFEYVHPHVVNFVNNYNARYHTNFSQHPVMWGKFKDMMPVMIWKKNLR